MVLGAYCEALASGRRVAVLGDGSTGIGDQLAKASGRRAQIYDPNPRRTAAQIERLRDPAGAKVGYVLLDGHTELRREAFDLVVVPDLGEFSEPAKLLAQARSMLSPQGVLVVASPSPGPAVEEEDVEDTTLPREAGARAMPSAPRDEGLGYYELYDLVSAELPWVRMLGQAPFVGFTVADFSAEGVPPVTIDTSLQDTTEEPEWFVAVASVRPVRLDPYVLIQVPSPNALEWLTPDAETLAAPARERAAREALAKIDALAADLERLREREKRAVTLADERRAAATAAAARAAELEQQLARMSERETELRRTLAEVEEREQDLEEALTATVEREAELEDALSKSKQAGPPAPAAAALPADAARGYEFQLGELRKSLAAARTERDQLREPAAQAERLRRELAAAQEALAQRASASSEMAADGEQAATHAREIAELEETLQERGRRIAQLDALLAEAQRTGRELVRELAQRHEAGAIPGPAELDTVATPVVEPVEPAEPSLDDDVAAAELEPSREFASQEAPAPRVEMRRTTIPPPPPAAATERSDAAVADLQLQLELLSQKCSTYQADLEAARWTIASLRHEVAQAATPSDAPDGRKLEDALRSAQLEIARLRGRLRDLGADTGEQGRNGPQGSAGG